MNWIVLDCRKEGIERLSIVDRNTEQVICRIENTVSGRPIGDDDLANAALISTAPRLLADLKELTEDHNRGNRVCDCGFCLTIAQAENREVP